MKSFTRNLAVGLISLAAVPMIAGCVSRKETTTTIPASPPEVVVQPAPVAIVPSPSSATVTTERSVRSGDMGNTTTTQERTTTYRSDSTTAMP